MFIQAIHNMINYDINRESEIDREGTPLLILHSPNSISPNSVSPNSIISVRTDYSNMSECFICLENEINGLIPINIDDISEQSKNCACRGKIHVNCLNEWLRRQNVCPICRTPYNENLIIIKNNADIIILYGLMIAVAVTVLFFLYLSKRIKFIF